MKLYFPVINLLRGIAALLVAIYHFTNFSSNDQMLFHDHPWLIKLGEIGFQGVFIFFVISGVVIPVSMYSGGFKIKGFHRYIARRWVRIELPYIATIGLVLLVAAAFAYKNHIPLEIEPGRIIHHLTYTIPFTKYEWYNVIFWTLAIEFQYYLIIGVLYPLITSHSKWIVLTSLLLFGCSILLVPNDKLVFFFAPIFATGILVFLRKIERISDLEQWGFTILMLPMIWYYHSLTVMIFAFTTALTITFVTVKRDHYWLGDISYSFYLTHGLVGGNLLYLLVRFSDQFWARIGMIILAMILSLAFAHLFWKWIEDPARRLSKRIRIS